MKSITAVSFRLYAEIDFNEWHFRMVRSKVANYSGQQIIHRKSYRSPTLYFHDKLSTAYLKKKQSKMFSSNINPQR
jgi:hypothetical protein